MVFFKNSSLPNFESFDCAYCITVVCTQSFGILFFHASENMQEPEEKNGRRNG